MFPPYQQFYSYFPHAVPGSLKFHHPIDKPPSCPRSVMQIRRSTLSSYSRRQWRNASRYTIAQRATSRARSRILTSALHFGIEVKGQLTKRIVKDKSANNAPITSRALSESLGFGRRDQNQKIRESSPSLTFAKSRFVSSGSKNGGSSSYFQSGSVVRSLQIPPSFPLLHSRSQRSSWSPLVQCARRNGGITGVDQSACVRCFDDSVDIPDRPCAKKLSIGPQRLGNSSQ